MNNLRKYRLDLGLTQSDVLDKLSDKRIDKPMLSKMENGVCQPTTQTLKELSAVLQQPVTALCDNASVVYPTDEETTQTANEAATGDYPNTQVGRILRHLNDYGSITSMEAIQEYGILRLASRICDLKKAGVPIIAETVHGKNRYGETISYARYFIKENRNGNQN